MMPDSSPVVVELLPPPEPEAAFVRFASRPGCVFFDSAMRHETLGRYSFLSCDPFDHVESRVGDDVDPLTNLAERLARFPVATAPELPPFQGGAAGVFGYELGRRFEQVPRACWDEFALPDMVVGLYDVVVAWDHSARRAWIVSQGFPETTPEARRERAVSRAREFQRLLAELPAPMPAALSSRPVPSERLAPQFPTLADPLVTSDFSKDAYLQAVADAIEYIRAGDIFQVNLSQRLLTPETGSPVDLYLRLRQRNPAPFAGWFDAGEFQTASASPERFLMVRDRIVETRPIKGTRRRLWLPEADLFTGDELRESEKDRAENVMIVDLLRNDLSRVCEDDSVRVARLCDVENYQFVQHLVSVVVGRLRDNTTALDLLQASFPGGSITGAPKIRAMEIVAELEPTVRGPYCGSMGYVGFDGAMDSNILIRTAIAAGGWWQASVGGGIVAASDPKREYDETWHKAAGMIRSLR